jgi:hypothetical protein
MSAHPPPVPPEQRPPHGGAPARTRGETKPDPNRPAPSPNPDERGRQGNLKQNTTHQGYQQDR